MRTILLTSDYGNSVLMVYTHAISWAVFHTKSNLIFKTASEIDVFSILLVQMTQPEKDRNRVKICIERPRAHLVSTICTVGKVIKMLLVY